MRFALLSLSLLMAASARADDLKASAKAQVDSMVKALVAGDFAKIADVTHPNVVAMNGGREKMIEVMTTGMKAAKEQGIEFASAVTGAAGEPAGGGAAAYVVVPFRLELKAPVGRLKQNTFVIGVTADAGKTWRFVNGDLDPEVVKKVLPELPAALKLPAREQPTIEKP